MNYDTMLEESQTRLLSQSGVNSCWVLNELQRLWEHCTDEDRWKFFNYVSSLIGNEKYAQEVWEWCCVNLRHSDTKTQIAASISILELITEEPIDIHWLERLFQTWLEPGLEWIIPMVYEERAALLYDHLVLLAEHKAKQHTALSAAGTDTGQTP